MASLSNKIISIAGSTNQLSAEYLNDYRGLSTKENLDQSDLFIFSTLNNSNPLYNYSTNLISYEKIYEKIRSKIISYNDTIPINSNWIFNKLSSSIHINTDSIKREIANNNKTVAINVDYFHTNIVQSIYDLSTDIYKINYLPSTIGDIITSSTLSTLELVKQIYGANTNWTQIYGKSIIGYCSAAADAEMNTTHKYGEISENYTIIGSSGSKNVRLEINNIPGHEHKLTLRPDTPKVPAHLSWISDKNTANKPYSIEPNPYDSGETIVKPEAQWGVLYRLSSYTTGVQGIKWTFSYWKGGGGNLNEMFMNVRANTKNTNFKKFAWKEGTIGVLNANFNATTKLSTKKIIGTNALNKCLYESIFDESGTEYTGPSSHPEANAHNNLPPFVTKYIWKRTS